MGSQEYYEEEEHEDFPEQGEEFHDDEGNPIEDEDDDGNLIDDEGNPIEDEDDREYDDDGNLIDEDGNPIDDAGNPIDEDGNPIKDEEDDPLKALDKAFGEEPEEDAEDILAYKSPVFEMGEVTVDDVLSAAFPEGSMIAGKDDEGNETKVSFSEFKETYPEVVNFAAQMTQAVMNLQTSRSKAFTEQEQASIAGASVVTKQMKSGLSPKELLAMSGSGAFNRWASQQNDNVKALLTKESLDADDAGKLALVYDAFAKSKKLGKWKAGGKSGKSDKPGKPQKGQRGKGRKPANIHASSNDGKGRQTPRKNGGKATGGISVYDVAQGKV